MLNRWRFPGNNFTNEIGLDTANMEMFKRDPLSSLAREICQNSIDARKNDNEPVKISFSLFTIDNPLIPEVSRLRQELDSCKRYMSENEEKVIEIEQMIKSISKNKITVLRISDFNTTGLKGVSDSLNSAKSWYLLTKGSGISQKTGTTGGSKGIGKYASFVSSSFRTVFYSTYTDEEEKGYQGIAYYMSTYSELNPEEKTTGVGFYGSNDKNEPILEEFNLDKNFRREDKQYGSDVYILGFEFDDWEKEITSKVLESFMVALKKNDLVVDVNGQMINNETIHEIINKRTFIKNRDYKSIFAQYSLLYDDKNYHKTHTIDGLGEFDIFIKSYNHKESGQATNSCMMVRYPYMKIKDLKNLTHIPHSAMCVINKDELNIRLRKIENPEHIDWEFKRIKNNDERKALQSDFKKLTILIENEIKEYLLSSDSIQSDIEGASEYLPSNNEGNSEKEEITEYTHVSPLKKVEGKKEIGLEPSEDETSNIPGEGNPGDDDGEGYKSGEGEGGGGEGFTTPGTDPEGDSTTVIKEKLKGIVHKFFVIDKDKNRFRLIVVPSIEESEVIFELNFLDDTNHKTKLDIDNVYINGTEQKSNRNILIEFKKNEKISIDFEVNLKFKFAVEVDFYAIK